MRSRAHFVLALACAILAPLACAHQLSVEQVTLVEEGEGRYLLRSNVPASQLLEMGLPLLPEHCRWDDTKEDQTWQAHAGLRFVSSRGTLDAMDTLLLPWRANGVVFAAEWLDGTVARRFFLSGPEGIAVDFQSLKVGSGGLWRAASRYTWLGVQHILQGVDHVLFLAGILLLVRGTRALLLTITAFTLAHSFTLALSVLGQIRLSQGLVEALVALSLVFLAVENVQLRRGRAGLSARFPWLVSFAFGLVHGLGFASALQGAGIPEVEIPSALFCFNVGVELAQLGLVACWFLADWALRQLALPPPPRLALVFHHAMGVVAMAWFLQRALPLFA
ncbi:MAG: HupE/UreJ family protein [Roseimicrobium sp.]